MAQNKAFKLGGIGSPCCCGGTPVVNCAGCALPASNLTVSWTSFTFGPGSGTLTWGGGSSWDSGCIFLQVGGSGLPVYKLRMLCASNIIQFQLYGGGTSCAALGIQPVCETLGFSVSGPYQLTITHQVCSPLNIVVNPFLGSVNCNLYKQFDYIMTITL